MNVAYSFRLKNVMVADILCIATWAFSCGSGGAIAANVPVTGSTPSPSLSHSSSLSENESRNCSKWERKERVPVLFSRPILDGRPNVGMGFTGLPR